MSINNLSLTGEIEDIKEISMQNGGKMYSITMRHEEQAKDFVKKMWVKLACFGEMAKQAYTLKVGDNILASGKLSVRSYDKKDGTKGLEVGLVPFEIGVTGRAAAKVQPSQSTNQPFEIDDVPF